LRLAASLRLAAVLGWASQKQLLQVYSFQILLIAEKFSAFEYFCHYAELVSL
jgi:hypothetical protein